MSYEKITDLRTALAFLKTIPGQYAETDIEADPICEVHGVYRYMGAGGTVPPPTREGPVAVFNKLKNYPGMRMTIGMLASRRRVAYLLGEKPERLAFRLREAVKQVIPPVIVGTEKAQCQEVVYRAEDAGFDIRKILPTAQSTFLDAGPCITMGLCLASDPETGESDVTVHRMFVLDKPDEITFNYGSTRHIGMMHKKAEAEGKPLPISVSIGLDPAVYVGACFEPPTTPFGFNELSIAGALRGRPVELAPCLTIPEKAIANAEFVIEGELLPGVRADEGGMTGKGVALPEFPGYNGTTHNVPILKIKAVTHRKNPIYQTIIGASAEHVNLVGPPVEASIIDLAEKSLPGFVLNAYAHPAGGGKFFAILQVCKTKETDEGRQRQAALTAFAAYSELKHIVLVDEDVDILSDNDVLWALTTRYQGNVDTVFIPGIRYHKNDPSATAEYSPSTRADGAACKTIFDCTVPYELKERFRRPEFMELNPQRYFPALFNGEGDYIK
jgi:4-hydroxy-3-polyprenylbenzoate decarboxylase